MKQDPSQLKTPRGPAITRRHAMRWLGGLLAAAPVAHLLACGSELDGGDEQEGDGESGGDAGASASADGGGSALVWATGGTAAMTALATYPNPFSDELDEACTPTCAMTLGPCHDSQAPQREDISEGQGGLPMRFALRILDDDCQPVSGADVDIWHCDVRGVYSSETADNPAFCTGDDQAALEARYFRGYTTTDQNGVAWFSTCFPGWYNGRAIHVHFTVRRNGHSGEEYLTSQVAFPAALISELCSSHPDYVAHGQPNTANTADSVFPSDSVDDYEMETQRMSDGALLAWKTIIIRSSLSTSVCAPSGSMMPGGPGGAGGPGGIGDGGMMGPPPGL